jgi:hypothetical protein
MLLLGVGKLMQIRQFMVGYAAAVAAHEHFFLYMSLLGLRRKKRKKGEKEL